jgi:hypothetical protein
MTAGRFDPCATAQVPRDPDGLSAPALGLFPYASITSGRRPDVGQFWNMIQAKRRGRLFADGQAVEKPVFEVEFANRDYSR